MSSSWSAGIFSVASKVASTVREQATKAKENAAELSAKAKNEALSLAKDLKTQALTDKQYLAKGKLKSPVESPATSPRMNAMPWEHPDEQICEEARQKMFAASSDKETFRTDPPEDWEFELKKYISVALKLLEVDGNLRMMHSRLSLKIPEEKFWRRYFYKCMQIREEMGIGVLTFFTTTESPVTVEEAKGEIHNDPSSPHVETPQKEKQSEATVTSSVSHPSNQNLNDPAEKTTESDALSWEEQLKADLGVEEFDFLKDMDEADVDLADEDLERQIAMELTLSNEKAQ